MQYCGVLRSPYSKLKSKRKKLHVLFEGVANYANVLSPHVDEQTSADRTSRHFHEIDFWRNL